MRINQPQALWCKRWGGAGHVQLCDGACRLIPTSLTALIDLHLKHICLVLHNGESHGVISTHHLVIRTRVNTCVKGNEEEEEKEDEDVEATCRVP
jgi:hypothetical protein